MALDSYRWEGADLILNVRLQPRAGRDQWLEPRGDRIGVRIAAPPVDGKANARLREFLADLFGVGQSQVTLLAGQTSRDKRLRVTGPRRLPPGIEPAAPS
ncbi:MAG: DUF167 family protein [Candidatus Competibacter sp.]|jgi:uncharacterized protein (TIGR00251 family)